MMCPVMTKDPVNAPVPCVENCAWKVQGLCATNVIAQSLYHQEKRAQSQSQSQNADSCKA